MQIKISEATIGDVKDEFTTKVDYITQYSTKPYFINALVKLSEANPENGSIICDYTLAAQTQMTSKESTKEGKIKVQ
jgi:Mg2+/Co2+ transporter CorC